VNFKRAIQLLMVAVPIFAFDYISKALISFYFQPAQYAPPIFPFGGIGIFQNWLGIDFCIHHVTNRGAAWGMFSGYQEALLIFRIAVIIGLFIYLFRSKNAKAYHFPLILILTGALANVTDYFLYGHVIDMFHFIFWGYSYPVFNVADSAIFCGIIWSCLQSYLSKRCLTPQNG
jgi:signal peptidase II